MVALVLSSCSAAPVEEGKVVEKAATAEEKTATAEEKTATAEEKTATAEEKTATAEEKPIYGGILTTCTNSTEMGGFDPVLVDPGKNWPFYPCGDRLIGGDWWKGPAGTNEWPWEMEMMPPEKYLKGYLVESWEMTDNVTTIYNIRKGVNWQDRPGVMTAREFTADDVVFHFKRLLTTSGSHLYGYPGKPEPEDVKALDKYTVEVKLPRPNVRLPLEYLCNKIRLAPPEVIEKYGDMQDWTHVVGTSAYIMTDYVRGSGFTYKRNPDYWMKDPEGRSLPYLDGIQILMIPDVSTRIAALRAGKLDVVKDVEWSDAESLEKTNPELMRKGDLLRYCMKLTLASNAPPFSDKMVRRAAQMAIDFQSITKDFYKGNAQLVTGIMPPQFEGVGARVDELPPSQKELFEYNPEKAKQLLAEAGYDNGFKTTIGCTEAWADLASVIKSYWDAIGIETQLQVREPTAQLAIQYGHKITGGMILAYTHGLLCGFTAYTTVGEGVYHAVNWGCVDDPHVDQPLKELLATTDATERNKLVKELNLYIIDNSYDIVMPTQEVFHYWYPWVKGYHGESSVGWYSALEYLNYIWLDQDLKKEMGY